MFSEELYELDRNTVQYMIDEMQETIDAQKAQLEEAEKAKKEQEKKHEKALKEQKKEHEKSQQKTLRKTIELFRTLNLPEAEIIPKICGLYELTEAQVREYLAGHVLR